MTFVGRRGPGSAPAPFLSCGFYFLRSFLVWSCWFCSRGGARSGKAERRSIPISIPVPLRAAACGQVGAGAAEGSYSISCHEQSSETPKGEVLRLGWAECSSAELRVGLSSEAMSAASMPACSPSQERFFKEIISLSSFLFLSSLVNLILFPPSLPSSKEICTI